MGKLEKYSSYKDSGVAWIGEIPEHWEIIKLSHITKFITCGLAATPQYVSCTIGKPFLSAQNVRPFKMDYSKYNYISYRLHKQLTVNRKIQKGDILLTRVGAGIGDVAIFNEELDCAIYVSLTHIRNLDLFVQNYYLMYFFGSNTAMTYHFNGTISAGGQGNLNVNNVRQYKIPLPPKEEQIKIASFLDEKTAQIDEVISQKEKLIELLKERKQIVINDAVTKGLDKDVEFVDSGVEWIGKIPKHWEVIKFKHLFYEKKKTHDISLNCGSISFGKVIEKNDEKIPASTKASYQVLNKGEFLINPLNLNYDLKSLRIGLSDLDVVVSSGYIIIKNKENIDKIYFNWLLHRYDIAFMKTLGAGVRQTLNFGDIAETLLVNPPIDEQIQIAEYIETQITKIDKAIELQQNYISKLKEYKASLIDSVVTGKVKVS